MRRYEREITSILSRHNDSGAAPGGTPPAARAVHAPGGAGTPRYVRWVSADRRRVALLHGLDLAWFGTAALLAWTLGDGLLFRLAILAIQPLLWVLGLALLRLGQRDRRLGRWLTVCGLLLLPWLLARRARGGDPGQSVDTRRAAGIGHESTRDG